MNWSEFHFLRPEWFWALPVLFALSLAWLRRSLSRGGWADLCDDRLLPYILEQRPERNSRGPWLLFVLAALLSIIALAGPTWKRNPAPVYRNESALVIVLDLSKSMDAEDIQPSRLSRARFKISDILQQRKDGLTALVVYTNEAYTVTPLTDDRATIANQLPALETSIMPAQGTRTSPALKRAAELLKQSGNPRGNILLITDGVDRQSTEVAEELSQEGYRLYVMGVGSEEGAPIPLQGGGFIKDAQGNIVVSRLETRELDSLARSGGGFYQTLTLDDRDVRLLLRSFDQLHELPRAERGTGQADQWVEEGPWLLSAVLPIAALAFRRGYLAILLFLTLPFPQAVHAWQWKDLWQTRDQQGYQAYQQRNYDRAAELFEDPAWKAASEYSAGKYQNALETLDKVDAESAAYNRGNALARSGRLQEALESYNRALELNPDDDDARYNKKLIQEALKQPDPPRNQSAEQRDASQNKESSAENQGNSESNNSGTEQSDPRTQQPDPSDRSLEPDKAEDQNDPSTGKAEQSSQIATDANDRKDANTGGDQAIESEKAYEGQEGGRPAEAEHTPEQELQQANEQWL
ncbi:MAG: VWA domain-containing protein, partial [Methylococcaceae bacterium]|nr:VWA domain-containing protein [Methylococcaceae bacterium]